MNALDTLLEALRATGPDSYRCDERPDTWHARCPACGRTSTADRLTIYEDRDGHVTMTCSLGCTREAILAALGYAVRRYPATWPSDRFSPAETGRVGELWWQEHQQDTRVIRALQGEVAR